MILSFEILLTFDMVQEKTKTRVSKEKMSEERQRMFLYFFASYHYQRIFSVQQEE